MSATPPAPAFARRARPAAAWLAFSAKMTAQVPAIASRPDLTVAPGRAGVALNGVMTSVIWGSDPSWSGT